MGSAHPCVMSFRWCRGGQPRQAQTISFLGSDQICLALNVSLFILSAILSFFTGIFEPSDK